MKRLIVVLALLASASIACSLTAASPTATPIPVETSVSVVTTPTVITIGTVAPTATTGGSSAQPTACTIHTDWQLYTVVAGDSLGSIAQRSGSTVDVLAAANCLVNPNNISVGQRLRVPVIPIPVTNVPVTQMGYVMVSSYLSADPGNYVLEIGAPVTLTWTQFPSDTRQVDFVLELPNGGTLVLGSDTNLADGALILWKVQQDSYGNLMGYAFRADGTRQAVSYPVFVTPARPDDMPVKQLGYVVSPGLPAAGTEPYHFTAGATVTLSWSEAPTSGLAGIDFVLERPDGSSLVLGQDTTPADGASIQWQVVPGLNGSLVAYAFRADARRVMISLPRHLTTS